MGKQLLIQCTNAFCSVSVPRADAFLAPRLSVTWRFIVSKANVLKSIPGIRVQKIVKLSERPV